MTSNQQPQPPPTTTQCTKIDPITAVQDSIDSLALSLFEALRGVRDAVAPSGAANNDSAADNATAEEGITCDNTSNEILKQILPEGVEIPHEYLSRAFDLLEPDYNAFVLAYLNGDKYAQELVDSFMEMERVEDARKKKMEEEKKDAAAKAVTSSDTTMTTSTTADDGSKQDANDEPNIEIGEVGYTFRKQFDAGWCDGKVIEIKPLTTDGHDRRVLYTDGDMEDLSLENLKELAKLDPNFNDQKMKKPRLSIKLKLKSASSRETKKKEENEPPSPSPSKIKLPQTQEQYANLLHQHENERDIQITQHLAQDILTKSKAVDNLVAKLPGMGRTRDDQMKLIEELMEKNHVVAREVEEAYDLALARREEVRVALDESTSLALGVEQL